MKRVWIAALSLVLGSAAPALAHAAYESSDPDDGSSVSSPPSRVIADFTEAVTRGSTLAVYDPCGQQVDERDSLVAGDRITVSMSGRYKGGYSVSFDVVSAVDGHNTTGTFTFTVTGGEACPGDHAGHEEPKQGSGGGRSGNSGSSGPDSTDRTGSGTTESRKGSGSRGGGAAKEAAAAGGGGKQDRGATVKSGRKRSSGDDKKSSPATVLNAAASSAEEREPSVWEGIPMGAFFVGLGLSMLIGAAGGKIYAGIMSWRA